MNGNERNKSVRHRRGRNTKTEMRGRDRKMLSGRLGRGNVGVRVHERQDQEARAQSPGSYQPDVERVMVFNPLEHL